MWGRQQFVELGGHDGGDHRNHCGGSDSDDRRFVECYHGGRRHRRPAQDRHARRLTGPIAQKGITDNATLAVKQLNDAGGVDGHPVKISFYDTMDMTPQSGRVAMQKALAVQRRRF